MDRVNPGSAVQGQGQEPRASLHDVLQSLEPCQILGSADTVNHAEAHKILARQNIGKFLLSEVISADENYYFKMLVEHKQLEKEKLNV